MGIFQKKYYPQYWFQKQCSPPHNPCPRCGLMVSRAALQAGGPGSIPGLTTFYFLNFFSYSNLKEEVRFFGSKNPNWCQNLECQRFYF